MAFSDAILLAFAVVLFITAVGLLLLMVTFHD